MDTLANIAVSQLARGETVKDLKSQCRSAGFAVSGTKQELAARLEAASVRSEPYCFRITSLPLNAGAIKQGSLRVTTANNGDVAIAKLEPLPSVQIPGAVRRVARVVPCAIPFAVSVVRHDNVFRTRNVDPPPVCDVCRDPAEVYDDLDAIPVHLHLCAAGIDPVQIIKDMYHITTLAAPPLLRVCRKGCLTYELQERLDDDDDA
ncbi:hypothetical protein CTAYLR_000509 [Chrysophaeum taylorii]|uniref:SAP domain-containing protein n=1 Tax=Chrysophaeum taylorii TaxID=2483200 RepID=A0AAD7XKA4_9STRA|nr:hypothetical protein CTAYLR_000509 [Chrysophaeum taylorii]